MPSVKSVFLVALFIVSRWKTESKRRILTMRHLRP